MDVKREDGMEFGKRIVGKDRLELNVIVACCTFLPYARNQTQILAGKKPEFTFAVCPPIQTNCFVAMVLCLEFPELG